MYAGRTVLNIWTVYREPEGFSARRFEVRAGCKEPVATNDVLRAMKVEPLRDYFERHGLYCQPRQAGDVENILESWF